MSQFLKLNVQDVSKGLVVAVIVAVLGAVQQMFQGHGLDFGSFDWGFIVNVAVTAAFGYLGKNLLSDSKGKFVGMIG